MQAQSLKTEKIDNLIVITGFQSRPIDPEETRKQSIPEFLESEESKELKLKQGEQERNRQNFIEAHKKSKYHSELASQGKDVAKNEASAKTWDKKRMGFIGTMELVNEDLKPLALAAREKAKDILRSAPIFFEPRKDEVIKTESELEILKTKFEEKGEVQQVLEDGNFVDDFRGKSYHKKTSGTWAETVIDALSVKKAASTKYTDELTNTEKTEIADQKETERVTGLSSEEKTNEYNFADNALLSESALMKSKLEIQGSTAAVALTQSKAFYNTELDKLKTKYGVA